MTRRDGRLRVALALSLLGAALLPSPAHAADAPAWLLGLAKDTSAVDARTGAIVLLDEVRVAVAPDGTQTTVLRYAARIASREGYDAAVLRGVYATDGGRVLLASGWVLTDGRTVELGREAMLDVALADNDVYGEARARVVTGRAIATPGILFGAEMTLVERTIFTQLEWPLQHAWPVRTTRRALTLPTSDAVTSLTLNAPPIEPVREAGAFVWTAQNLPALRLEPWSPPYSALTPRIVVTFSLPKRKDTAFESWAAVSAWLDTLTTPQAKATPEVTAKAAALTAGVPDLLDRIRAIGRHAQQVQYISIQTGLGRGGGYKPRAATDVLAKNYGDCKDKANLMKALLGSVGVTSYLVPIYSGDPDYVRPEWPSPQQFNHAILAVALPAATSLPAAIVHPDLGPLLFFDPTDEFTPVGNLPRYLEGSLGLVVGPRGPLVRMPTSRPDAHASVRSVTGTLGANGRLSATITHATAGDPASRERSLFKRLSKEDYSRSLERELGFQVPGGQLLEARVGNDANSNRFEVTITLQAPAYGQAVGGLVLIQPPAISRVDLPEIGRGARTQPVRLDFAEWRDIFELEVAGLEIDEVPELVERTSAFGRFSVQWRREGTRLLRSAVLQLTRATVTTAQAPEVTAFLDAFRDAERQPAVLARR